MAAPKKKGPFSALHEISKQCATLSSIEGLISWDQETYMPQAAIDFRSSQTECIASLVHKYRTSPKFAKALSALVDIETGELVDGNLSLPQEAAVREWRRDYIKQKKLPPSFVKLFAKTTSTAINTWAQARAENKFSKFLPHLEKIVALCRKKADLLGFKAHPYDALLDIYEPGMTVAQLIPLFSKLRLSLTELVRAIDLRPQPKDDFLTGDFPPAKQLHFAHLLLKAMGFSEETSRLDQSSHPFCTGIHPKDTRMTTHVHPDKITPCILSVIHEGGHGLYNMGLPAEYFGSPLGESASLGIDESQSRWWETRLGHSLPFWKHFYPILQKTFSESLSSVTLDEFCAAINIVKPSFIRIDADEVTYSLHIIVRFEIECALIEGTLKPKDVPQMWNEKMREYFGITPASDALGCLQDIHWSMGGIGYFPTYTLGNLYAAQFFEVFEKAHPDWAERIARGEFDFVREWLRENIHKHGRQYTPNELVRRVSGKPLSEEPFVHYLENKFKKLYHLS